MAEYLTFGTANAHMGRLFKEPGGLDPLADCEVVGFQEVHPDRDNIEERLLMDTDLVLASAIPDYGLAIAINKDLKKTYEHTFTLQERGPIGRRLISMEARHKAAFRTRARGLHGITFETLGGLPIHFANAHPIIPFKWRQRNRQVSLIPIALAHLRGPLVFVQDGNHCPGPRAVDLAMCRAAGLKAVELGNEATYVLERSKHAWLGVLPTIGTLQFDDILYRGDELKVVHAEVVDIESDHRARKATMVVSRVPSKA